LKRGRNTIEDFCKGIHKGLVKEFKQYFFPFHFIFSFIAHKISLDNQFKIIFSAWVWGTSVKHNPQKVGIDHVLEDEDVVQIIKRV